MPPTKTTFEDNELKTYEIFFEGIPRGTVNLLAAKLRKHPDIIRRWMREPLSDDNPYGTGRTDPLARFLICFEHFLAHSPAAAEMTIHLLQDIRSQFLRQQGQCRSVKDLFAEMVREVGEVIAAAGTNASADEIEREGSEAIAAIQRLITECKRTPLREVG